MKLARTLLACSLLLAVTPALADGINASKSVRGGEVHDGNLSTLNGRITIGDGAEILGRCSSVNGGIEVGENVRVEELSAVNGTIEVGRGTQVDGTVEAVNGRVSLERGARALSVQTVNGRIEIDGAEVDRDVTTVNGDVGLSDGARVGGDILIDEPGRGSSRRSRPLRIVIDDAVVEGRIVNEASDRPVEVIFRDGGRVEGEMVNVTVIDR